MNLRLWLARVRSTRALVSSGVRQSRKGDNATAAAAFQLAASSGHPHHRIRGAVNLWLLRSGSADRRAADAAYRQAAGPGRTVMTAPAFGGIP